MTKVSTERIWLDTTGLQLPMKPWKVIIFTTQESCIFVWLVIYGALQPSPNLTLHVSNPPGVPECHKNYQ
jgi:hypothetical protein